MVPDLKIKVSITSELFRFLILFLLCPLVLVGGCSKNPVTGESNISLMDRQEEIKMGRQYYPLMTQRYGGELYGKTLQTYVQNMGEQIASVSDRPNLPYTFNVVNSATHNAYALPGGFITITRGLLFEMDREAQLAAVLGHEIVHAAARHSVQQQTQGMFTNLLLTAGSLYLQAEGVQYTGLYQDLGRIGASAYLANYSRAQEEQADRLGMRYMAKAGYDPHGMIELQKILLRLKKGEPGTIEQFFASHPMTEERIDYSKNELKEIRGKIDPPTGNQLNRFEPVVVETWFPRKPAYRKLAAGRRQLKNGKVLKAVGTLREARSKFDGDPLIHAWLGGALNEAYRFDKAREALDRGLKLTRNIYRLRLFSGINSYELGRYQQSLTSLRAAQGLLPGMPEVIFYKGRNYEALGVQKQAADLYIRYLKIAPRGENADYARRRLRTWGY
jgi:predicted Zn-dependent protease